MNVKPGSRKKRYRIKKLEAYLKADPMLIVSNMLNRAEPKTHSNTVFMPMNETEFEMFVNTFHMQPEKKLVLGIIRQVFVDLGKEDTKEAAIRFVREEPGACSHPFTFARCCEWVDMDLDTVKRKAEQFYSLRLPFYSSHRT